MNRFLSQKHAITLLLFAAVAALGTSLYAQPGDDEDGPVSPLDAVKRIDAAYQMIALGRDSKSPEALLAGAIILHENPAFDLKGDTDGTEQVASTKPDDLLKEARAMRVDDKALGAYIDKLSDRFAEDSRAITGFSGGTFAVKKGATGKHEMTVTVGGGAVSVTSLPVETFSLKAGPKDKKGKPTLVPVKVMKTAVLTVAIAGPDGKSGATGQANPTFTKELTSPAGKYTLSVTSGTLDAKYVVTVKSAPALVAKATLKADPERPLVKIDVAGLKKVVFPKEHFKDIIHAPIKFKPFPLVDPKTGNPVKATDVIVLKNGSKVVAEKYYTHINKLEAELNLIGHSMRTMAQKTVLHEAIIPHELLKKHSDEIEKGHIKHDPDKHKVPPTIGSRQVKHDDAVKTGVDVPRAVVASPKTYKYNKNWNYEMGKHSTFASFVHGDFTLEGNTAGITLKGDVNAGGYLMNHKMILLEGKGSIVTNPDGKNDRVLFNVTVMGATIYNLDSKKPNFNVSKSFSKSVDYATAFSIQIGPIPITGKIGVRGTASVHVFFGLRPSHASLHIKPHLEVNAYAQAGVGIPFASVGVEGNLLFLRADMDLGAEVDLKFDAKARPYIEGHLYMQNSARFLAGSIGLYAHVDTPWPFDDVNIHRALHSWPGYSVTGYAFNDTAKYYLDK
ncbi:MAG: hypothetical protein EXR98_18015 [Gemmataceae bacterium]|nr:hypothetical protein [Gemmataceae bacterium]